MKTRMLALVILAWLFSATTYAQKDYTFKVLVNKGKNEVKSADGWQPVKVGASLKDTDELKLAENCYLGLVHVSGKPLEVKQAGKYKIDALAKQVSGGTSVLNKYTDFILSSNTSKGNTLTATGAVHRGPDVIELYLPESENSVVFNNEVIINWDASKIPGPYVVSFNSMFGDLLEEMEAKESNVKVNLSSKNFENEDNILVVVRSKSDKSKISKEYTLKKLSKADKTRINTLLKEISGSIAEKTAMDQYILAGFYEENKLIIDAITAYQELIRMAPDVPGFQEDYSAFLIRNGLKVEKK
ncbi:MAG TPA: hypothetical protein PLJ60_09730 [Chryseolinea sp.]|nr:hypothetical protein [Chryseolinea sp.]